MNPLNPLKLLILLNSYVPTKSTEPFELVAPTREPTENIAPTGRNRFQPSRTRLRVDPLVESYDPSLVRTNRIKFPWRLFDFIVCIDDIYELRMSGS